MAAEGGQAGPGFFSLRSLHLSEIVDDGSYVFIDPDNVSQVSDQSTSQKPHKGNKIAATIWAWTLSAIFTSALLLLPVTTFALFIPVASLIAFPLLILLVCAIFYSVPSLSYLSLAQKAAPPSAGLPFLPPASNYRLLFRVNLAALRWLQTAITLFFTVTPELVKTYLLYVIGRNWAGRVKTNVRYANRASALLDVYYPKPIHSSGLLLRDGNLGSNEPDPSNPSATSTHSLVSKAPIIVFLPAPHYGPIRTRKWMMASLGRNLARMGYCVVIPDVVAFGDVDEDSGEGNESAPRRNTRNGFSPSRIRDSVHDLRSAMRWAYDNGSMYGGDPSRIYLAGHGLGAHLALLHVIQRAVVSSREAVFHSYATASQAGLEASASRPPPVIISNGTRRVHEYGKSVWAPPVEGLILFSAICDVEKQVTKETELGIAHLSTVRRALGPGQLPCIMHSPAHILHASRNILDLEILPKRVVFFHGGFDRVVHWSQSENMKELLRGVGVEDVKSRIYTTGHTGMLTGLMSHERGTPLELELERESE
ncbi:alpha/beta-hydrolase [Clavulina sp. PMI_390]|nr:alpha/beta-hydrolase [Clavulina sp. PMI_390]